MLNFRKHFYFFCFLIIITYIWWFFYLLVIFPKKYHSELESISNENSVIVVLTGGKGRFEKGFSLLKQELSKQLFVSGVFPGQDLSTKYDFNQSEKELFDCCVTHESKAVNTRENAKEVKRWIEGKNIEEIVIVSSYYHLPRSRIIFEKEMPTTKLRLIPTDDDVFDSETVLDYFFNFKVIVTEYLKILYIIFFEDQ